MLDRRVLFAAALGAVLASGAAVAQQPAPAVASTSADVTEFQALVDEYGRLWTMTDGAIDLTRLDRFYAPDGNVTIIDFAPPGISRSWAAHREGLQRELFGALATNSYVPRRDVTVRRVGDGAAVTTFTFDYANRSKDGREFTLVGRQTNVWERRDGRWVIVHEHGSPVPGRP